MPIYWSPVATFRVFKYAWLGRAEELVPARESMTLQELLPLACSFLLLEQRKDSILPRPCQQQQ